MKTTNRLMKIVSSALPTLKLFVKTCTSNGGTHFEIKKITHQMEDENVKWEQKHTKVLNDI